MSKKKFRCVLYDKNGFHINARQASGRLRRLRYLKTIDREFYEGNAMWYDEKLLRDFLNDVKKGFCDVNGLHNKNEAPQKISVLNEAQAKEYYELINVKLPRVCPDTYPCGVLIKSLEG